MSINKSPYIIDIEWFFIKNPDMQPDILFPWLDNNYGNNNWEFEVLTMVISRFRFKNKDDAIEFKLRYG